MIIPSNKNELVKCGYNLNEVPIQKIFFDPQNCGYNLRAATTREQRLMARVWYLKKITCPKLLNN